MGNRKPIRSTALRSPIVRRGVAALAVVAGIAPLSGAAAELVLDLGSASTTAPLVSRQLYGMNVARWDHDFYPAASPATAAAPATGYSTAQRRQTCRFPRRTHRS